jgi:hypothetical protein
MLVNVYSSIWSFTVTCVLHFYPTFNVLGKSPIRDSNNRETGNCYWWIWQKYNTHVTVKDHIYEYTLTNMDKELYCYSNEFHSHLPFDRPCINLVKNSALSCQDPESGMFHCLENPSALHAIQSRHICDV